MAIIYEDGPYGAGVAQGNEEVCKKYGMDIVLKEGYSATSPDLSSLVTKLRRARADVILHTGYNPDITLFWRQAREQGLKWAALIGHGAGYGQYDKLKESLGKDAEYIYNVDPVAAQLLDPKTLKPGIGALTQEMVKRYRAETKATEIPPHASMGFNQTWIFLNDVLPRAIKKHGGKDPEALKKAALETDIPDGRHDPGLRRQVLRRRARHVRAERALHAGGDAVRQGPDQDRLADTAAHHRCRSCRCRRGTATRTSKCSRSRGSPSASAASPPSTRCPSSSRKARSSG